MARIDYYQPEPAERDRSCVDAVAGILIARVAGSIDADNPFSESQVARSMEVLDVIG
jgi:hypothetical protein